MNEDSDILRVFTGSEVSVILLKGRLEEVGVSSMIKNEFHSGVSAGFVGGTPTSIDLFIQKEDMDKAKPIVDEFINNKGN